jgi:hypothetical protein
MKVYKCVFVYDNNLVRIGDKFVIFDGCLVPVGSNNGCGLEMSYLGLDKKAKFNQHFAEDGEISVDDVPFISNLIKEDEGLLKECENEIKCLTQEINELKSLR